jgi:hypothetical protein
MPRFSSGCWPSAWLPMRRQSDVDWRGPGLIAGADLQRVTIWLQPLGYALYRFAGGGIRGGLVPTGRMPALLVHA